MSISFTFSFTLPTVDVPIEEELAFDLEVVVEDDEEAAADVDAGAGTDEDDDDDDDEEEEEDCAVAETVAASSDGGIQFSGSRPSWMYTSLIIVAYSRPPPSCAERISFARSASHLCFCKNARALSSAAESKCAEPFFAITFDLTNER